ncbi:DUF4352 domain-containing protein [Microbacterium hydrocarbonoxydans]|uniref:DUF4352 domain-containing protein n=1 Tax=Microbacterium hydrocarbonoxydans TaxID=273678 RepID=UPI0013DB39F4|nr:DUF4352 domain-containing protein [Microbacterium hydrocarbonoxydans]
MKRALPWLTAAGLFACAWLVALATPDDPDSARAFVVQASLGERAEGRNLAVTVHDVRAARAISTSAGWRAEGTWVVVELDAEAVVSQYGALLSSTTLTVGDRVFSATERGVGESSIDQLTLTGAALVPGIPKTGALAFQLPDGALTGTATLELAANLDPDYDSIIALTFDLDDLPVEADIELIPVDWSGS